MSGKYAKKKNNRGLGIIVFIVLVVLAAALVVIRTTGDAGETTPVATDPVSATDPTTQTEEATEAVTEEPTEAPTELPRPDGIDLGRGLVITDLGSYSGKFMEDGSDDEVSDVLMIVVYNYGVEAVQYAEIAMTFGDKTANFVLSTLPVGERIMLLESGRMAYDADAACTAASVTSVARFASPMSLCQDKIKIQGLDGAMNIMNISDEDIAGEVAIYYKNSSEDLLCGGITYRVRIDGGMKAGEIKQIMTDHYSASGSRVMFVTCG